MTFRELDDNANEGYIYEGGEKTASNLRYKNILGFGTWQKILKLADG